MTFLDWRNQFVPLWLLMISDLGFKPRGFWCAFGRYVYAVAMVTGRMVKPAVLTDLFYSVFLKGCGFAFRYTSSPDALTLGLPEQG